MPPFQLRAPLLHNRWPALALGLATVAVSGALFVSAGGSAAADGATVPLPYHLSLPGVAADDSGAPSTGGDTGGTGTVSPLVVTRHISLRFTLGLTAYGEIYNGLDHAITSVSVTGSATADDGTSLGDRTVTASTSVIPAHGVGVFAMPFFGPAGVNPQVTTEVTGYTDATTTDPAPAITLAGPKPVEIISYDSKTHQQVITLSPTDSYLDGMITNTTDHAITGIEVLAVFYDGAGNVALVAPSTQVQAPFPVVGEDAVLQPGQTGTFRVPVLNEDYTAIPGIGPIVGFANFTAAN